MSVSNQIRLDTGGGEGNNNNNNIERRNIEKLHGKSTEYYSKNPTLKLTVGGTSQPFHWTKAMSMAWIQTLENRYRYQQKNNTQQPGKKKNKNNTDDDYDYVESASTTMTTPTHGIILRLNNMILNPNLQKWFEKSTIDYNLICQIQTNDLEHLYLISIALKSSDEANKCTNLTSLKIKICISNDDAFGTDDDNNEANVFGLYSNEEATSGGRFLQSHHQSIQQFAEGLASPNCCIKNLSFDLVCFGMERSVRQYLAKPLAEGLRSNQSISKLTIGGGWDNKSFALLVESLVPTSSSSTKPSKAKASAKPPASGTAASMTEVAPLLRSNNNNIKCLEINGMSIQAMVQSGHIKDSFEKLWKYNTTLEELIFNSCFEEAGNDTNSTRGKLLSVWLSMQQASQSLKRLRVVDMNLQTGGVSRILPAICCAQQQDGKVLFENLEILDLSNNRIESLEFVSKLSSNDNGGFMATRSLPSLKALLLQDNPAMKLIENLSGKYPINNNNNKKKRRQQQQQQRNSRFRRNSPSSSQLYLRISKQQQYDNYQYLKQLLDRFPKLNQIFASRQENHKLQPIFCNGHDHFRGLLDYQHLIPAIWPYYLELASDIYDFSSCIDDTENENRDDDEDDQESSSSDDDDDDDRSNNSDDGNSSSDNSDGNNREINIDDVIGEGDDSNNGGGNNDDDNGDDVPSIITTTKKNDLQRNIFIDRATSIFCLVRIASECGVFEDHNQQMPSSGVEDQQKQGEGQRRRRGRKQKKQQTKQKSFFGRLFRSKRK